MLQACPTKHGTCVHRARFYHEEFVILTAGEATFQMTHQEWTFQAIVISMEEFPDAIFPNDLSGDRGIAHYYVFTRNGKNRFSIILDYTDQLYEECM